MAGSRRGLDRHGALLGMIHVCCFAATGAVRFAHTGALSEPVLFGSRPPLARHGSDERLERSAARPARSGRGRARRTPAFALDAPRPATARVAHHRMSAAGPLPSASEPGVHGGSLGEGERIPPNCIILWM